MRNIKLVRALVAAFANIPTTDVEDSETIENHGITENDFYEMITFFEEHYGIQILDDATLDMTVKELRELIKSKF